MFEATSSEEYNYGRVPPAKRAFDGSDLKLLGVLVMVVLLVLGTAALLGLAVRIFLIVSGLR